MLHVLKEYSPKNDKYVTLKNYLVDNASKFYKGRENIIEAFEIKIFPFYNDKEYEEQMEFEKEEEQEEIKTDIDKFSKYIAEKEKDINQELFKKHFGFQKPSDIFNSLIDTKDIE